MNKKYYMEAFDEETLAGMIDKTLNFEKNIKNKKIPKANIIKIVSVAALLLLFIGFLNFLPMIINFDDNNITPANLNEITDGENTDKSDINQSDLFLPDAIEQSFFEEKILNIIPNKSALNKILAYYMLRDSFYNLAINTSNREKNQLLDYLLEYTDITRDDMLQMCADNNIPLPKKIDPAYAHVRFGDDENTLLLEVEWYTYETYMDMVDDYRTNKYKNWDEYIKLSDKEKLRLDQQLIDSFKNDEYKKYADLIKDGKIYVSRLINGKPNEFFYYEDQDISSKIDENGYIIFNVYPFNPNISYYDENDIYHDKQYFNLVYSKIEYTKILEEQVIPLCDDLLARGLITQEKYDLFTVDDPLDFWVKIFFE